MKKHLPTIIISFTAIAITLLLSGNQIAASENNKKPHLSNFLSIHNDYCEKKYNNHDSLTKILEVAPGLSLSPSFVNVYEVNKNGISYAVSPEKGGCTTDVMIQTSDDSELFSFEDINEAMIDRGYIETGKVVSRKDVGTDQTELIVLEKKYVSPEGEITTLDFPLEKKNKYYMTLFAEKFSQKKEINKKPADAIMTMTDLKYKESI